MNIYVRVKAAGKRRDILEKQSFAIPNGTETAKELISYIVKENVREYNEKEVDAEMFKYLTQENFQRQETIGKIGFADRKNEKNQDEENAVENALQCFEDGIYRMLINENEVSHLGEIEINEEDVITFIRLVMLAGRRW